MVDKKTAWMKSIANGAVPKNKHLAILLSSLPTHDKMNLQLEQYTTPGDLASRWINEIYNLNNFEISEYDIVVDSVHEENSSTVLDASKAGHSYVE